MKFLIALALLAGFAYLFARTLFASGSGSYPQLYPQILLAAVCVLLAGLAAMEWRARTDTGDAPAIGWQPVLGLGASAAYVALWGPLGHAPATAAFLVVALLIAGERRPLIIAGFAIALAVLMHVVFVVGLRIPLPRIPWL